MLSLSANAVPSASSVNRLNYFVLSTISFDRVTSTVYNSPVRDKRERIIFIKAF